MKSPEFLITDREGHEERLSKIEAIEGGEAIDMDDLAEQACDALEKYKLDRSVSGLADMQSALVSMTWNQSPSSSDIETNVSKTLETLRMLMQEKWRAGDRAFLNEDIFAQFGKAKEKGVVSDILFLMRNSSEAPVGMTRGVFYANEADKRFSIDFIVTYRTPDEDASHLVQIDLVQNKTSFEGVSDLRRDADVRKHKDFLRDRKIVIEQFRSAEVEQAEVDALITTLGEEVAKFIEVEWMDIVNDQSRDQSESYAIALNKLKERVSASKTFTNASRTLRKTYIEMFDMGTGSDGDESAMRMAAIFAEWKADWLGSIKDTKKRVLEPVHATVVRSVIAYRNGEDDVEVIGKID